MAKIACKGTQFQQSVSEVLTDVAQVISLDVSGAESETYDSTTLDVDDAYKTYDPTGYTEPGSVDGELFYDPALVGHTTLVAPLAAPAATDYAIIYQTETPTLKEFTGAGLSFGATVAMDDGLKGSFSIKVTGAPPI